MKKKILTLLFTVMTIVGIINLVGCTAKFNPDARITVVSREDGSGTRSGFDDIVGMTGETRLLRSAIILNSTGGIMAKVSSSPSAIGYISLGSANSTIQLVSIDGIKPSAASIKDNSYKLQRNFSIVTKTATTMSNTAKDYIKFMLSTTGQDVVKAKKYIQLGESAVYNTPKNTLSGKLTISGSSSVAPLMQAFKASYANHQSGVTVTVISTDSGSGVQDTTNANADKAPDTIGMISRELKPSEKSVESTRVAIDGIAVIANNLNPVNNLTIGQLRDIYTGTIKKFSEIIIKQEIMRGL